MLFIGVDLGTSSVKLVLFDGKSVLRTVRKSYPVFHPQDGWSEQNPEDWYTAVLSGIGKLLHGISAGQVAGISFSGQMHGLVTLDAEGRVIRRAILWNDGRCEKQVRYLNEEIGEEYLVSHTGNIAFAGFTAPKLLWMRENEPELFAKIDKIMLPKDYIAYRLTGRAATDVTDASGTLLFDVKNRCWSREMCDVCGISGSMLPDVLESCETSGTVLAGTCGMFGLRPDTRVVIGAGDNAASAVGVGAVSDGDCNLSLGTSGTMLVASGKYLELSNHAIHFFCHANGGFHTLACILSAASAEEWWIKGILDSDYNFEEGKIRELGTNRVFFLPYLAGERSPHNDTGLRGVFFGLSGETTREDMTLAVMEGVAFAFRDNLEIMRRSGICVRRATVSGGGASSALWRTILCNVLGIPLLNTHGRDAAGLGAALIAARGCGTVPEDPLADCELCEPDAELVRRYEERYHLFREYFSALEHVPRRGAQ